MPHTRYRIASPLRAAGLSPIKKVIHMTNCFMEKLPNYFFMKKSVRTYEDNGGRGGMRQIDDDGDSDDAVTGQTLGVPFRV